MSIFKKESKDGVEYINQKYGLEPQPVKSSSVEFLYTIYDKLCDEYNPPFVCRNMATAIRNMKDSLKNDNSSLIKLHPEDYLLVELASFDKYTGLIVPVNERVVYEISKMFEVKKDGELNEVQNK